MRRIVTTGESGAQARNSPTDGGEWCSLAQLVTATDRRVLLPLRAEKGCRDGQQVGESRRARTKTYVTEGGGARSAKMCRYTPSGTVTAAAATFKQPLIIRYSVLVVIVLDGSFDCFFGQDGAVHFVCGKPVESFGNGFIR